MPPPNSRFSKNITVAVGLEKASEYTSQLNEAVRLTMDLHDVSERITKSTTSTVIEQQALLETQKYQLGQMQQVKQAHISIGAITKANANISDKMMKAGEQEAKLTKDDLAKTWALIDKTLMQKNAKHTDELKMVQQESSALENVLKKWDGIKENIRDINTATESYLRYTFNVYRHIKEAFEAAENFNTVNYRIYGTQTQITTEAYRTASAYSLIGDEAIQAYKVLGAFRLSKNVDDFRRLTLETIAFSKATGLSIEMTAGFQKTIAATSGSLDVTGLYLIRVIGYMREFGLSSAETTGLLAQHSAKLLELRNYYGSVAINITDAQLRLAALAKEFGGSPELINQIGTSLQNIDPMTKGIFASMAGYNGELKSAAGNMKYFSSALKIAYSELKAAGDDPMARAIAIANLQGKLPGIADKVIAMATQLQSINKTPDDFEAAMNRINSSAEKAVRTEKSFMDELKDATNNVPYALRRLSDQIGHIFKAIGNIIAPIILIITDVLAGIAWVFNKIINGAVWLLDVLGPLGIALKTVIGLFLLGPIIGYFGITLMRIGVAVKALTGFVGGLISKIPGLTAGFASIGTAILNMFRALLPVVPALIGLGILFAGVGIAAYGLASAVEKLSAVGMMSAVYLGVMAGAIIGLGVAFAYIGRIAQAGAAGLVGLGVAFAGIGAAAFGIGFLIQQIGNNWKAAAAAGAILTGIIVAMTGAIAVMGAVGTAAAGPLLALGAAFLMIGGASVLIGYGLKLMVEALNQVTVKSAIGLGALALALVAAGGLLLVATSPLNKAATELFTASGKILGASLALAVAAVPFMVGTTALGIGSTILLVGSAAMFAAMAILRPAVAVLGNVAMSLGMASMRLTMAVAQFKAAMDGSFLKASAILVASAAMILAGSLELLIGAPILLVASGILIAAVKLLAIAAPIMDKATQSIAKSAIKFTPAATAILAASIMMLAGGALLLVSSIAVGVASAILLISGIALMAASVLIGLAAGILNLSGGLMVTAGFALLAGAISTGIGAVAVGIAAIAVGIAGAAIWLASKPMQYGAENLLEAGNNFLAAGQAMSTAGPLLKSGISAVDTGTDGITRIGLSIWAGSKSLKLGAEELLVAVLPLSAATTALAMSMNNINVALAKPYTKMFDEFSASLTAASGPMMELLDDISTRMASYASDIESSTTRISKSFNDVNAKANKPVQTTAIPVSRDTASMLSPEVISANIESDKKIKLMERQIILLTSISVGIANIKIGKEPSDENQPKDYDVLVDIRDILSDMSTNGTDKLLNHMSDWKG